MSSKQRRDRLSEESKKKIEESEEEMGWIVDMIVGGEKLRG